MAHAFEDLAVRFACELPPAPHPLGSAGLWLLARAVEPRVLNSFPVVVLPALCPGLEYHAPGVYAGDRSHSRAIASEGKRKASCPIVRSLCESPRCCKCLQCAKAEPMISVTSVLLRSQPVAVADSVRRPLAGRRLFQHPGSSTLAGQRVKLAGLYSDCPKSRCRSAVHFSKAPGINSACGAS